MLSLSGMLDAIPKHINMRCAVQLQENQSALILETDESGEISVNVASGDLDGITARICEAIATKLMSDDDFQADLMDMVYGEDEEE